MKTDFNSIKNQDIKGKFIAQHVYCNVNSLAEYCLSKGFEDSDSPLNYDEIENLYTYPEWSKTVLGEDLYFEGGSEDDHTNFLDEFSRLEFESEELLSNDKISEETHERNLSIISEAQEEFSGLETEMQEIFEWWAVSEYLANKLKEKGHVICDTGSVNIWGRTTTGQAILLDGVISRICNDMEILEGQANDWSK